MDDEKRMVICVPTDRMARPDAQHGSVVRWCQVCGTDVWAAQSTLAMIERYPGTTIVCNDCAPGLAATEDEVTVRPVRPSEVEHIPNYRQQLAYWKRKLEKRRE